LRRSKLFFRVDCHIFHEEEDEKGGNGEIDEPCQDFSVENAFVREVFQFFYLKFFEEWGEEKWGDKVFHDGFGEVCDFFCDEQSDGYSEDIIGLDEGKEFSS
jgi:hypothetical protein